MKYQIPVAGFFMLILVASINIPSSNAGKLSKFKKFAELAKEVVEYYSPKIAEKWNQDPTKLQAKVICNRISEAVKLYSQNRNRFTKQQIIAIYKELYPVYKNCVANNYIIGH